MGGVKKVKRWGRGLGLYSRVGRARPRLGGEHVSEGATASRGGARTRPGGANASTAGAVFSFTISKGPFKRFKKYVFQNFSKITAIEYKKSHLV